MVLRRSSRVQFVYQFYYLLFSGNIFLKAFSFVFSYILDFVASIHTVILCRLHKIFCGLLAAAILAIVTAIAYAVSYSTLTQYLSWPAVVLLIGGAIVAVVLAFTNLDELGAGILALCSLIAMLMYVKLIYYYASFAPTSAGGPGGYGKLGQAMRESAKRILYASISTNMLNGHSSNSRIEKIMVPWEIAIIAADVILGILCVASIAWVVTDVVKSKKKVK